MSLIPAVGRKSPRIRLIGALLYLLLTIGAISTVYPFLIMIGTSMTSEFDQDEYVVAPAYLFSFRVLFGKYASDKYSEDPVAVSDAYNTTFAKLSDIRPPQNALANPSQITDWHAFFASVPAQYRFAGFRGTRGEYAPAPLIDRYQTWLRERFRSNIQALDKAYTEEDTTFLTVFPPIEQPTRRLYNPVGSLKEQDWAEFQRTLPLDYFVPVLLDPVYQAYLHDEVYSGKIADLNRAWGTTYTDFSQVTLPATVPSNPAQAVDWTNFVHQRAPLRFLRVDSGSQGRPPYGHGDVARYPSPLPTGPTLQRYAAAMRTVDPKAVTVISIEALWRAHVHDTAARPPLAADDWLYVIHHSAALRLDYVSRNYRFALSYLLVHGRGIWNTVIYCSGAVLIAIIVNPLCAYALSRFRLPWGTNVLIFLLATMAFPGEVAMIPNFLLLKSFHLLNTFWALILPGAASGFSIFLLKGFFDSLPQELYEAGMIDGASELTLFRHVTFPLSRPIFAVIALQAFGAAYGAFLFAMILCQAQSHWTLMVWIYEFQALAAPQYVMMAALVIASLPTLIVFLFAQNVIMRGIILPSFK
jgi:multiple sugar transport system permease protein